MHNVTDFLLGISPVTRLFPGQKQLPLMLDNRSEEQFAKNKENMDSADLSVQIFSKRPNVQKTISTEID